MNAVMELLLNRKSVRVYEKREIGSAVKDEILAAAMRAPTAGGMMLYSIIEVKDQAAKDRLVETCDHQPFLAQAPLVLLFLADYQRWHDYFVASGVERLCEQEGVPMRKPEEGDLFLACCDALIAAQTAVIAAESLGIGSCYIGDIMENYEIHKELFDLPQYVFPICLLCFGYPTEQQQARALTPRFPREFIVFEGQYKRLTEDEFEAMYRERHAQLFRDREEIDGARNIGQLMYVRKFNADFSREMNRSVRAMVQAWTS
ncbi:MAG: nitroreductase family protein [Chloroflexi bacterium]|nr:nitroreductase family protein [Chloroflexota bacterium]MBU1749351.1 nitroreductase family protein [Chloroflexota bacterium]